MYKPRVPIIVDNKILKKPNYSAPKSAESRKGILNKPGKYPNKIVGFQSYGWIFQYLLAIKNRTVFQKEIVLGLCKSI